MKSSPFLSVVIPTYNRCDILIDCLYALAEQTISPDSFEVIVGDDGSTDSTFDTLNRLKNDLPYELKCFTQSNKGPSAIRNRALFFAEAPVVVFFNDDTIALPDCLSYHVDLHKRYSEERIAVLGLVTIDPSIRYSPFSKLHLDYSYSQWGNRTKLDWRAFYTCNLSVKKSFLEKCGFFDEDMKYGEDIELGSRLGDCGLEIILCRDSIGYHRHFLTESDYLNIAAKEGLGLATWFCKNPAAREKLMKLNFPLLMPWQKQIRYFAGDLLFQERFRFLWLWMARKLLSRYEVLGLEIYKKCYQAIKREVIRKEVRRRKCLQ